MNNLGARRWWALGAIMLAVLAVGLDGTIISVALPTLAHALNASESDLQWFTSAYLLVLAAAMLPAGLLGDRFGRKKVIAAGLVLFGAGSAACAVAPTAAAFIAARAVLGIAGAAIVVMSISALTVLFSEAERPRAVGIWAAANFLALPIGPILGGWLLTNYWWGWVFLLNVPVALIGLIAVLVLVPESRAPERPGLDPLGIITSTAGLVALTYGLIQAGQNGWSNIGAVSEMGAGLVVLVLFFLWEGWLGRRPHGRPLVDLRLFRLPAFTWGAILAAVGIMAQIGVLFTMPQYFQAVLGTDAQGSGLRLLPLIGGLVLGAVPADRVASLMGVKITVAIGFAVLAAGMILGAQMNASSGTGFVALWMAMTGFGMGLGLATAASGALSVLPAEKSGVGSAVLSAFQKTGAPFGAAILGSVLNSIYQAHLNVAGLPPVLAHAAQGSVFGGLAVAQKLGSPALAHAVQSAFITGMDGALVVSGGIAVLGMLLTLAFLPWKIVASARKQPGTAVPNEGQLAATH
jgi:DHA2 family multidrug resistance protein-like MFS transporter